MAPPSELRRWAAVRSAWRGAGKSVLGGLAGEGGREEGKVQFGDVFALGFECCNDGIEGAGAGGTRWDDACWLVLWMGVEGGGKGHTVIADDTPTGFSGEGVRNVPPGERDDGVVVVPGLHVDYTVEEVG